ncbi:MAG: SMP-30/gluconolactonase/LRE family protein [Acidobacteriota bacterium]|nr:SMP-30/gluconolactonase/LRE family protein [Acidobacteriota bacterium]
MRSYVVALLFLSLQWACAPAEEPAPEPAAAPTETEEPTSTGSVDGIDPRFSELIAADATVEKVAEGFQFIEGPVWVGGADGHLLFSDIPADTVYQWSESGGQSVFLNPVFLPELETGGQGGSNGLTLDHAGRVILCEHGNRRVARIDENGTRVTVVDRVDGKRLNSPNDIVYHSSGAAFFTDPPYGLAGPESAELEVNGVYRLDNDGTAHLEADGQSRPNGIGLSPDQKTLYVANSDVEARLWMAYSINDDLSLGEGTVHLDLTDSADMGVPDGLAVDTLGNLWASGPGGIVVIAPDGTHLGTVRPAEQPANAGFGDDGKTLYMTARTGLYRVRTNIQGILARDSVQ